MGAITLVSKGILSPLEGDIVLRTTYLPLDVDVQVSELLATVPDEIITEVAMPDEIFADIVIGDELEVEINLPSLEAVVEVGE